jgi:hypothetical protein
VLKPFTQVGLLVKNVMSLESNAVNRQSKVGQQSEVPALAPLPELLQQSMNNYTHCVWPRLPCVLLPASHFTHCELPTRAT